MNVKLLGTLSLEILQKEINKWLNEECWDENGDLTKEVIDIKFVMTDDWYTVMIIYKFV